MAGWGCCFSYRCLGSWSRWYWAGVVGTLAVFHCFRARTTVHPHCPEKTSCLVAYGVFRLSRNPMYLALLLLLIAWMIQLGHLLSPLWLAGFVAYITWFQIRPEEAGATGAVW